MPVNFYLDKRQDKKGDVAIRVSVSISGSRIVTSSGLKISPSKWDSKKQQVKKGAFNSIQMSSNDINSTLNKISSNFLEFERYCVSTGLKPTSNELKSVLQDIFSVKDNFTGSRIEFWDYYSKFIKERSISNQWTFATHQKFNTLRHHIEDWMPKGIKFESFNESGLISFISFLREKKDLMNSTIGKQIDFLKWFLRWAYNKGYNTNPDFLQFNPKLKSAPNQVIFLDWDELMRVYNFSVPPSGTILKLRSSDEELYSKIVKAKRGLEISRDIFLLCCFTSLRFSDAQNLKRSDIKGNAIHITTIKTSDTITIELNDYALEILSRYQNEDLGIYAMPRISNQKMNQYIKDVCEFCEINQLVTHIHFRGSERIEITRPKFELIGTHTGRRTFICNALSLGIPAEIVMKWTGHADYKSMKPYIDIANKAKADAMKLFNKK